MNGIHDNNTTQTLISWLRGETLDNIYGSFFGGLLGGVVGGFFAGGLGSFLHWLAN